MHQYKTIHPQTRLIIAVAVGFLIALVATVRIWIPTLSLLSQFFQFSPLARAAITVKLLSPLLSFVLTTGWVWVLLSLGERLLSLGENKEGTHRLPSSQNTALPEHLYRHERSVPPPREEALPSPRAGEDESSKRLIATPPLFQLDPTHPWQRAHLPVTPFPLSNPNWFPMREQGKTTEEQASAKEQTTTTHVEQILPSQEATSGEVEDSSNDQTTTTQAEQIPPSRVVGIPTRQEEQTKGIGSPLLFPVQNSSEVSTPLTLTLLKQVRCWIRADDGTRMEVKLRDGENAIRLLQLAYIAWRRGASVDRDKLLTHIVARGKRNDMNTDQLGEVFDAAKRYLRQDVSRAIKELAKNGHPIADDIDFFSNEPGFYWLHPSCRVVDLDKIEELSNTIQMARKDGILDEKLDGTIPSWLVETCQNLIASYPGDFLQSLMEKFPEEFGAWVKEPVTLYRDKYLDALLIMANYESAVGRNYIDADLTNEQIEEQRRPHIARAAQLFFDYAMYAINSRWDQKLKFAYNNNGKDGERVVRSERAMRRCIVELGKLGNPDTIDQRYLAFKERMRKLSDGHWKPSHDTESDVADAKRTTNAYRFSSQLSPRQDG